MPVHREGKKIVETATGRVVGHSTSSAKAEAAVRVRNAILHGWRPSGRRRRGVLGGM